MKARHRPPSLVSMWMLDVFCCALGCVTLLWLLNTRNARIQAEDLQATTENLRATTLELENSSQQNLALNADLEKLNDQIRVLTQERDEQAKRLALVEQELASTQGKLVAANTDLEMTRDDLSQLQTDRDASVAALTKKLETATTRANQLQKLLRQTEQERDDLTLRAVDLEDKLNKLNARYQTLDREKNRMAKRDAEDAELRSDQMRSLQNRFNATQKLLDQKSKELARAQQQIIDLQGNKKALADKYNQLRASDDNRFAGIAMTGKRVLFLIDISGSMERRDLNTPDLSKWPLVCETVGKVMRSVPSLEQFQVILFAPQTRHLFAPKGRWLDFRGEPTVTQVVDSLKKVEVGGDTNMFDAMNAAFQYRSQGLDTIYLFSDGLPNAGPGLTPAQQQANPPLTDTQQSNLRARYIRTQLDSNWNRTNASFPRVKINSIGFFYESPEVGAFLWALSRENNGSFVGMSRP